MPFASNRIQLRSGILRRKSSILALLSVQLVCFFGRPLSRLNYKEVHFIPEKMKSLEIESRNMRHLADTNSTVLRALAPALFMNVIYALSY